MGPRSVPGQHWLYPPVADRANAGSIVYLWTAPGPEINNGYVYLAPQRRASPGAELAALWTMLREWNCHMSMENSVRCHSCPDAAMLSANCLAWKTSRTAITII